MDISKVSLFYGTVLISLPSIGMAVLSRQLSAAGIGEPLLAVLPQADAKTGAFPVITYPSGTSVLCAESPTLTPNICYIIGTAPMPREDFPLYSNSVYHQGQGLYAAESGYTHFMFDTLIGDKMQYVHNRNYGATGDTFPGDYIVQDKDGLVGWHIGQLLMTLRGSPLSFMEFSALDDKIRLFSKNYELHTLIMESGNAGNILFNNRASDLQEALGLPQGTPAAVEKEDGTLDLSAVEEGIPLFRMQHVEGKSVGGAEDLVVIPPEDAHTTDTPPFVASAEKRKYTGELSKASALSLSSVKTPGVSGVYQLGYGTEAEDLRDPYEYTEKEQADNPYDSADVEQTDLVDDEALAFDYEISAMNDYASAYLELMAKSGLCPSNGADDYASRLKDTAPLGGPAAGMASYPLPDSIELTDPVTGETRQYFATTSFISQRPDGSILIADGYGSEIRMTRGNIIISSALDTWIRPGRSCIAMVPGHFVVNTQKTLTLNSSNSIYVRAVENLKLSGATGKAGAVVLESLAEAGFGDTPGGLVIRSKSNLSVTGRDLYIGRNMHKGTAKGKITEPDSGGAIVLDAGMNGVLMQRCGALSFTTSSLTLAATTDTTGAAVIITPNSISLCAEVVYSTGVMQIGKAAELPAVVRYTDNGITSVTLGEAKAYGLYVQGNMLLDGAMRVNDSMVVCKNFAASTVSTALGGASGRLLNPDKALEVQRLPEILLPVTLASGISEIISYMSITVYQDMYVNGNQFVFPSSAEYGMPEQLRVPGMLWQQRSEGKTWKEDYIIADDGTSSACFPGYAAWEGGTISVEGYAVEPLSASYIVNT